MSLSKEKLTELRRALPHTSINRSAHKASVSRQAVHDVFAGKYENDEVIKEALIIIKERKVIYKLVDEALS